MYLRRLDLNPQPSDHESHPITTRPDLKFNVISLLESENTAKVRGGGSGCGSVGRAVASNSRGPRFESSHWIISHQSIIMDIYCQLH